MSHFRWFSAPPSNRLWDNCRHKWDNRPPADAMATLIPIAMFLLFQSVFLRSAGLGGAVKG